LSGIAAYYQEYSFRGLVFHYVPTSGMVSGSNTALGSVMMQTSYRSNDTPPTSKTEILNEYWSNEIVPFESMAHPIECDPKENPFAIQYVRTGELPAGDNKLLYDLGVTYVAVQGAPANVLGDVWVTYEVELKKPILTSNSTGAVDSFQARFPFSVWNNIFTSAPTSTRGNLAVTYTGTLVSVPAGNGGVWLITLSAQGALAMASGSMSAPALTNAQSFAFDGTSAVVAPSSVTASASNVFTLVFGLLVTDRSLPWSVNFNTSPSNISGTFSSAVLTIAPLQP
jgi:hypothetical protein